MRRSASITTVDPNDHAAAAAYLMKHKGATAAVVVDGERSDRPMGIITETDIVQAAADGKDLNEVRIRELIPHEQRHTVARDGRDGPAASPRRLPTSGDAHARAGRGHGRR